MTRRHAVLWALAAFSALSAATCLTPLYTLPAEGIRWFAALMTVSILARRLAGGFASPDRWTSAATLAGAALLALLLPAAWQPGLWVLALGAALWFVPGGGAWGGSLVFSGAAVSLGHMLVLPASYLHAMVPRDLPVGLVAQWIARATGSEAAVLAGDWVLATPDESLSFSLGPEWTGLTWRLVAMLLFVILWVRARQPGQALRSTLAAGLLRFAGWLVLACLWGGLVFVWQSQSAAMRYEFELPWSPLYQALVALPVVLLAGLLVPLPAGADTRPEPASAPGKGRLVLAFLAMLCAWLAIHFEMPFGAKPGRVLVDDSHSDWEWTGEPMNTTQFGTRTTYNYHGLARLLERHYRSSVNFAGLTPALLDTVDVLVLKTPTRAYSPEEIEAVLAFVKAGGGLYLISDHTDVFGMSTFLNEITRHFGFEYNKDTVFDLLSTDDQFWEQTDIVPHPAFQHLPWYRYLTGCSIRPGLTTRTVAMGPQTGSDQLSYSTSNFFDVYYPRTELRCGNLFQVVAARYGKGKVLGFSDSTTYSNFAMFLEGRLEHLLGIIAWLNQRALPVSERLLFGFLALLLAAVASRRGGIGTARWLAFALVAAVLVILAVRMLNAAVYTLPERHSVLPGSVLDTGLSRVKLPGRNKLEHEDPLNMETFLVWLYRSGNLPERAEQTLFPGTELYVLLNPAGAPDPEFRKELDAWMKSGGRLLVAAMAGADCGNVNEWLKDYGTGLGSRGMRDARVEGAGTRIPVHYDTVRDVLGGPALYHDGRGTTLAVEVPVGKGTLIVSGLAEGFNNAHLGRYDSIPSELAYEYLQIYYRHTGMSGAGVEAHAGPPGLNP